MTTAPLWIAAALLVTGEAAGLDRSPAGIVGGSLVAAAALAAVCKRRETPRLVSVLWLAAAFQLAWVMTHLVLGVRGDLDPRVVYGPEGRALLHGTFPHSPYPVGAVLLFCVEALLGGGGARTSNALLMVPFHVLEVGAVWLLRTRWSAWIAAALALWPANAFFWEFRFDLVPAAAIVVGVVLARREHWLAAGIVLGLGAAVKWTPGLTAAALVAWLIVARRPRAAALHIVGVALPLLPANLTALLLAHDAATAPYRAQSVRAVTGESLPYLPLRLAGLAHPPHRFYGAAVAPGWTGAAAVAAQLLAVAVLVVLAARAPTAAAAAGRAALVPAIFLLTNRIFSPQFFVVVLASCACATALVLDRARALVVVAITLGVATTANAALFPGLVAAGERTWASASAAALLPAVGAVGYLASRSAP